MMISVLAPPSARMVFIADHRIESLGQVPDELRNLGVGHGTPHAFIVNLGVVQTKRHVATQRVIQQSHLLRNVA